VKDAIRDEAVRAFKSVSRAIWEGKEGIDGLQDAKMKTPSKEPRIFRQRARSRY